MKTILIKGLVILIMGLPVVSSGAGFEIANCDSSAVIRFQGAMQFRTSIEDIDKGKIRETRFFSEARRIRLTTGVMLPDYRLTFKLHLSFAPGSLELMDFYGDYGFRGPWRLRLGQFKTPFTRYRIQSFQRLTFVDWAVVTKYFGAERQIGLAIHNGYEKPPRWGWAAGIFTGVNARAAHAVGLNKIYGEIIGNPSDLADPAPQGEYHPELFMHASYRTGDMDIVSDTDEKRRGLRGFFAVNAAWDIDPDIYADLYLRLAPEFLVKFRGLSLAGIGFRGMVKTEPHDIVRPGIDGMLIQTAYRFYSRYEISFRYAIADFEDALVDAARKRAEEIIGKAEFDAAEEKISVEELNDIKSQYGSAGMTVREEEITTGINIYFSGHSLKWQTDAGWLIHYRCDDDRRDFIVRSQFQLTF